jgi:hypothetical protein
VGGGVRCYDVAGWEEGLSGRRGQAGGGAGWEEGLDGRRGRM